MCGVFGLMTEGAPAESRPPAHRLDAMECALRHRGRDGTARLVVGAERAGVALGLVRLALVGRGEAARVVRGRCQGRTVHAVMNGEIYEHHALRRSLEERGVAVEGATDAAVAASIVAADGIDALFRLRATFAAAFVIEDARDGARLVLARDSVGKKPLFTAWGDLDGRATFGFASEAKGLVAAGLVDASACAPAAVERFLARGLLHEDEPLFAGVHVLGAGCVLELSLDDLTSVVGGRAPSRTAVRSVAPLSTLATSESAGLDKARWLDDMARAFVSATSLRVPDEASACVSFSGGADSALVAHEARRLPLVCVRVPEHDESATAFERARAMGRALDIVDALPAGGAWTRAGLRRALALLEVPDAGSSWSMAPALLALGDALHERGVRVALTGEGADEVFLGYPWHALAAAVEHGVVPRGLDDGSPDARRLDAARGLALADALAGRPARMALDAWLCLGGGQRAFEELARALSGARDGDDAHDNAHDDATDGTRDQARATRGARARQLDALDVEMKALPVLHADRLLLSCGVEARMPFLDLDVVRLALQAPAAWLEEGLVDGGTKPLLYALARRVAPALALPPKRGFTGVPRPPQDVVEALAQARVHEGTRVIDVARAIALPPSAVRTEVLWRAFLLEETVDVVARAAREGVGASTRGEP